MNDQGKTLLSLRSRNADPLKVSSIFLITVSGVASTGVFLTLATVLLI